MYLAKQPFHGTMLGPSLKCCAFACPTRHGIQLSYVLRIQLREKTSKKCVAKARRPRLPHGLLYVTQNLGDSGLRLLGLLLCLLLGGNNTLANLLGI